MNQETGETRDAIIEADNKDIEAIINANRELKKPYWIVLFAKEAKGSVDGKPTLKKYINPYFDKRPRSQVGMIIGEVNNARGNITWEINLPQKPFDFDALQGLGAKACDEVVIETTTIANAYVTK